MESPLAFLAEDGFLRQALDWLTEPLFHLNETGFSLAKILLFLFALLLLFVLSKKLQSFVLNRVFSEKDGQQGSKYAVALLLRYVFLLVGVLFLLNQIGVELSTLTVALGALGVGIGFGLQTIVDNLFSGIIILLEKPIKLGDRVELDDVEGNVISISLRATTIKTNDNVRYIVPNSEFISKTVINWSHGDQRVRRRISVGVAYDSDPDVVEECLLKVARENKAVLDSPEPDVLFREFGDSSLNFELRVWTEYLASKPGVLTSQLNKEIFRELKERNISIPFPQRDIYIKEQP